MTWTKEFQKYVDDHSDVNSGHIAFVHHLPGKLINSFAIILPVFFDALVALNEAGVFVDKLLVRSADCTFLVEWNKYVFGILYVVLYRRIRGRWRKTPWPVCIVSHVREDKSVYRVAFQKVDDE